MVIKVKLLGDRATKPGKLSGFDKGKELTESVLNLYMIQKNIKVEDVMDHMFALIMSVPINKEYRIKKYENYLSELESRLEILKEDVPL